MDIVIIMACVVTEHIAWTKLFPVPPVVITISTRNPTHRNKFLKLLFNGSISRILKGSTPFYFQSIVHSFPDILYYTECFMIFGHHCRRLVSRYLRSKNFPSTWSYSESLCYECFLIRVKALSPRQRHTFWSQL